MTLPLPSVMLVDDHPLFRQGLRMMLLSSNMLQADIHEAGSVTDAVAQEHWVNLVMLDISMPGCDGLEGIGQIRKRWPGAYVVMLSGHDHPELMRDAVRQGASGFISKALEPEAICAQVQHWLLRSLGMEHNIHKASGRSLEPAAKSSAEVLPLRQYEVLKMLAKGFSNKAIAKHFGLSEHTIRNQVASILKHLGADTRTQAVLVAQRNGILPATAIK
ncbi:response regulator transcription factor [Comamonas sp. MYb21]|uniref:response regulator transcription factor n=1 Tax=Comamonas sp. MYb21 TaxID=1848648 RepID=UPI0030A5F15A